jgi:hypothetical protein
MYAHRQKQAFNRDQPQTPFSQAKARLMIGSLDDDKLTVMAHYNPVELNVKKTISWEAPAPKGAPTKRTSSQQDSHEYKGAPTRTLSLDLLFDGYEDDESVEPVVRMLETMTLVRDPESTKPELRRPHFCVVAWGRDMRPFRCVITSFAAKYSMFAKDGRALRATCSVELTEARLKAPQADNNATRRTNESMSDEARSNVGLGQRY